MDHRQLDLEVRIARVPADGGRETGAGGRVFLQLEVEVAECPKQSWVVRVNFEGQAKEITGGQPVFARILSVCVPDDGGKQRRGVFDRLGMGDHRRRRIRRFQALAFPASLAGFSRPSGTKMPSGAESQR